MSPGNSYGASSAVLCLDTTPQILQASSFSADLPACRKEKPRGKMSDQTEMIKASHGRYEPSCAVAQFICAHQIPETVVPPPPPNTDTASHAASPDPARVARINRTFLQPTSAAPVATYPATAVARPMSGEDSLLLAAAPSSTVWLLQARALVAEVAADVMSRGGGEQVAAIMAARLGPDGRLQVGGCHPSSDRPSPQRGHGKGISG